MDKNDSYTAFAGAARIATGPLPDMLRAVKHHLDRHMPGWQGGDGLLIFHDATGKQTDFDFRGSVEDVLARALPKPGPGRPKLGVVSREVSLLPRHWEWLEEQPNGASATLRRLIDEARKNGSEAAGRRQRTDAAGRVMTVLAGDRPGFEEAYRSLYAGDRERLERQMARWPRDIRAYILERLSAAGPETTMIS